VVEQIVEKLFNMMAARILILHILANKVSTGYSLLKEISRILKTDLKISTFYTILHDLEREGYIKSFIEKRKQGIKYYQITDKGLKVLSKTKAVVLSKIHVLSRYLEETPPIF